MSLEPTGVVVDGADRIEAILRAIPAHSELEGEPEERFRRLRQRIGQRQGDWRRSMGSLRPLFDDDAHCAKALAGNLATELTEILGAWARIQSENRPPQAVQLQALLAWIEEVAAEWQSVSREYVILEGWKGEAVRVFDGFLGELGERAVTSAVEQLHRVEPRRSAVSGRWGVVGWWSSALIGALVRFFHPRPPRSQ